MLTAGPWKLIWWGNEKYPFPLNIQTLDGGSWIARDGTVSSKENAMLLASAPDLKRALEEIAEGMVPTKRLDDILELTREGKLAEARGALYGWCQERAREALKGLRD